jgi:hypothetical protein
MKKICASTFAANGIERSKARHTSMLVLPASGASRHTTMVRLPNTITVRARRCRTVRAAIGAAAALCCRSAAGSAVTSLVMGRFDEWP